MVRDRSFLSSYFLYVSVIGVALTGMALGLPAAVPPATGLSQQTQQERTVLDLRMENAREIRQALARPLPRPEPHSRITIRASHAVGSAAVPSNAHRRKLIAEAREVFANIEPSTSDARSSAYAEPDRHSAR